MTAAGLVFLLATAPAQFDQVSRQAAQAREQNRVEEALRLYQRAVELRPAWGEGWWYIGSLHYDRGRFADAAAALNRLIKIEPESSAGWALLGLSEYQLKRYDAALESLLRAQLLGLPNGSSLGNAARYHRAILKTRIGQFEAAFDELKRFPFLNVESPNVLQAIGIAGLRLAKLPDDVPADQKQLVLKTGRAVYDCWAVRINEADAEFRDLILTHPENPHLRYLYGAFLLESRQEDALRELRRSLELDLKYVPAMLQIAFAYLKWGEPAQGLDYARQAALTEPGSFVAHLALGRLLVSSGELNAGIIELQEAVRLAPEQAECRFALASAYEKALRTREAAREKAEFQRLDALRRQQDGK